MKKHKQTIIIVVAIVVVMAIYFAYEYMSKYALAQTNTGTPPPPPSIGTENSSFCKRQVGNSTTTLFKNGDCGDAVRAVQAIYNDSFASRCGKPKILVDGQFGSQTEAAFQTILNKKTGTANEFITNAGLKLC